MTISMIAGMSQYRTTQNKGHDLLPLKYVIEKVKEKAERSPAFIIDRKFKMRDFPNSLVTWGAASAYVQPKDGDAYRVLIRDKCIELEAGLWCSPLDAVRYYLDYKMDRLPLRGRGVALDKCRFPKRKPPGYASPWVGTANYYDLKSAFWSIAQVVGWNVEYSPGAYLRQGKHLYDFPFYWHKVARNSLITIGIQDKIRQYDTAERKFSARKIGNKHKNIMLWAVVLDVLNAIAVTAVAHGARYVNTDGYIIPHGREKHALEAMGQWGLPIALDYTGDTEVRYLASYKVGDKVTGHWLTPGHFNRLQLPVDYQWLQSQFSHFAKRTTFINSSHER